MARKEGRRREGKGTKGQKGGKCEERAIRTGGADTKLGLDRLTSSPYVSPKLATVCASWGCTNPSLMWMLPEAFVFARVEVRGTEKACEIRNEHGE